jgi:hypothetical protein
MFSRVAIGLPWLYQHGPRKDAVQRQLDSENVFIASRSFPGQLLSSHVALVVGWCDFRRHYEEQDVSSVGPVG